MSIEDMNIEMFNGAAAYLKSSRRPLDDKVIAAVKSVLGDHDTHRFLDVGCGVGFLCRVLKKLFPESSGTGIDAAPELIRIATERAPSGVVYSTGDVYQINAEDSAFDLTACQTLMIHLKDPMKAIREMMRVTKPGGRLLFIEPVIQQNGIIGYAPVESSAKKELRDKLHLFDYTSKATEGIDMGVAIRLPSLLLELGTHELRAESVNILNVSTETASPDGNEISYTSYDHFMMKLGFPKDDIDQLKRAEHAHPSCQGEVSIVPLLVISAEV